MTNILQETVKTGTARKLSDITTTELASKTGTVGKKNGNIDAYNITFCPEETIGVWYGELSNIPSKITSGNQPTNVVKDYIITQTYQETEFETPSSVTTAKIDSMTKENEHRIVLASPYCPNRYTEDALFSRFNMPSEVSKNFTQAPEINADCKVENSQAVIKIQAEKHLEYKIFKDNIPCQTVKDRQGEITIRLALDKKESQVKIKAKYQGNETAETEKSFKLFRSNSTSLENEHKKWYI